MFAKSVTYEQEYFQLCNYFFIDSDYYIYYINKMNWHSNQKLDRLCCNNSVRFGLPWRLNIANSFVKLNICKERFVNILSFWRVRHHEYSVLCSTGRFITIIRHDFIPSCVFGVMWHRTIYNNNTPWLLTKSDLFGVTYHRTIYNNNTPWLPLIWCIRYCVA